MVDEVNKLIGNILAERTEVSLPEIGTLWVERIPAQRISRKMMRPPHRRVTFRNETDAKRLATYITEVAKCDVAAADEIYARWKAQTMKDGVLTIEGIGVLRNKQFTMSEEFTARLNPQGTEPVRMHCQGGFDWVIGCGIAAIACGLFFGGYYLFDNRVEFFYAKEEVAVVAQEKQQDKAVSEEVTTDEVATANGVATSETASTSEPSEPCAGSATSETATATTPTEGTTPTATTTNAATQAPQEEQILLAGQGTVDEPAKRVPGRSYVVLGVFGTKANARRTLDAARGVHPDWNLGVYRLGNNLMVTAFESDKEDPCQLFKRAYQAEYTDMWIHQAR